MENKKVLTNKKNRKALLIILIMFSFICWGHLHVLAKDNIEIQFKDNNLYNSIVDELNNKYAFTKNDNTKTIIINENELTNIKEFNLDGKAINDISGLEKFIGIEKLILNNNYISNISNLYTLNNLSYLDLSHNKITSINNINQMAELKHLDLYDNIVRDLSGLSNMNKLEYLNLGDNNEINVSEIANLDNIRTLTKLKYLNFSRNNTNNIIQYIENMQDLEFLNLQENKITTINNLPTLAHLKELYLNSNSISDIGPITKCRNLEVLFLNDNNEITSLSNMFSSGELVFKDLKKIHIYGLRKLNDKSEEITYLKGQAKLKNIELGYENIYGTVEPHMDTDGTKYVTYEDFGARCDGIYDDMISIRETHKFANSKGYEVRATAGKEYHIFSYYEGCAYINTTTDWNNANIIIHDENIENFSGRFDHLFVTTSNYSAITKIENPQITINTNTKKIEGIDETLEELNEKGFKKYLLIAENKDKKQHIRFDSSSKSNSNNGDNQIDCFEIDSNGNVLNDIQWDFEKVTNLSIYPVPEEKITFKNGNFITNSFNQKHDVTYGRGYGKSLYYNRDMFFWAASNIDIVNLKHNLSEDRISGSYFGFLVFRYCSDINIKDTTLYAREFRETSRSTYDLKIEQCVNFNFENVISNGLHDSNRWGVMGTAHCKDFVFENVKLNRIDAHQGIYNLTVRNSYIGYHGFTLTGKGTLTVENTTVESEYFINLRWDYGSTWTGDVYINNCTHKYQGKYMYKFINFTTSIEKNGDLHDFGYEIHQPNIYIENYTIDCSNKRDMKNYPIIANFTDHNFEKAKDDYWPENIYINGYKIINNDNAEPYITFLATNSEKINNNFIITDTKLKTKSKDYTHQFNMGETFKSNENVTLEISKNNSANNTVKILKNNEIIVNDKEINEAFSYEFSESGLYTIKINSNDTHLGKTGEKEYSFTIEKNQNSDIIDENVIQVHEILDNEYNQLTNSISIISNTNNISDLEVLSGCKKGIFELDGNAEFKDLEVTLKVDKKIANDSDVLALYQYKDSKWQIFGYYEVIDDKITFETETLGKYAIVNKTQGTKNQSPIITNTSKDTNYNFRDKINKIGIYSSDEDICVNYLWGEQYATNLEFIDTTFKTNETGILNFNNMENDEICNFYFENCTFDGVVFKLKNKGHYVFNNCTFINSPEGSIEMNDENVNIYLYNSHLKDNNPSKEEFNENAHSERAWKYSAIGFRRNNCSAHVVRTTIENYMTNDTVYGTPDSLGNKLYFEYSAIKNVEGQAIGFYAEMKGRIDNNEFYNIGELRGKNGYAIKYDERFGGYGVGGNAVFCNKRTREMRVYKNNIKNVMENAVEGHYYCVNDNTIESTGYRFEEGFENVSTEAIWGGSWQVKNNKIKDVHGRGIMINRWDNHPTEVSGNTVIKTGRNVDEDYEGIRININEEGNENVIIKDNKIEGFVNKYRVLNSESKFMAKNIEIYDKGDGKLMGNVYSSLRGIKFESDRQQKLDFMNANMLETDENGIKDWNRSNVYSFEQKEENGIKFGSFTAKDKYGKINQQFDLPKETCIVCLKVKIRSSKDTVNAYIISKDDNGNKYPSSNGGVYTEYKIPITGVDSQEFNTYYVCFKAIDHSTIGLYTSEPEQTIDIESIEGNYMIDDIKHNETIPTEEHIHSLTKVEKKQATCEENGNIEYYICNDCKKIFSDSDATQEIEKQDIIIYATGHDWEEWKIEKEATVDEEGIKTRTCKHDASHQESEIIPKVPYGILEGANQIIDVTKNKDITIKANGNFDKFIEVHIDGTKLDKNNYTAKSGSTIITLKAEYLSTLNNGMHNLNIIYQDGEISTNFTIENSSTKATENQEYQENQDNIKNDEGNQENQDNIKNDEGNQDNQDNIKNNEETQNIPLSKLEKDEQNKEDTAKKGILPKTGKTVGYTTIILGGIVILILRLYILCKNNKKHK